MRGPQSSVERIFSTGTLVLNMGVLFSLFMKILVDAFWADGSGSGDFLSVLRDWMHGVSVGTKDSGRFT